MRQKILDALRAPVQDSRCVLDLLVGGILLFFPVLNFFSLGFVLEKLRRIVHLDRRPLKWDDSLSHLFRSGARAAAVLAVYLLLPFLLMLLAAHFTVTLSEGRILSISFLRGQVIEILMVLLFLASIFILPVAFCLMAETGRFRDAFNITEVLDRILLIPKSYSLVSLVILGLYLVTAIVVLLILNWVSMLALTGFFLFYDALASAHLAAKVFPRKSIDVPLQDPGTP